MHTRVAILFSASNFWMLSLLSTILSGGVILILLPRRRDLSKSSGMSGTDSEGTSQRKAVLDRVAPVYILHLLLAIRIFARMLCCERRSQQYGPCLHIFGWLDQLIFWLPPYLMDWSEWSLLDVATQQTNQHWTAILQRVWIHSFSLDVACKSTFPFALDVTSKGSASRHSDTGCF